jgi:hypothetical protein
LFLLAPYGIFCFLRANLSSERIAMAVLKGNVAGTVATLGLTLVLLLSCDQGDNKNEENGSIAEIRNRLEHDLEVLRNERENPTPITLNEWLDSSVNLEGPKGDPIWVISLGEEMPMFRVPRDDIHLYLKDELLIAPMWTARPLDGAEVKVTVRIASQENMLSELDSDHPLMTSMEFSTAWRESLSKTWPIVEHSSGLAKVEMPPAKLKMEIREIFHEHWIYSRVEELYFELEDATSENEFIICYESDDVDGECLYTIKLGQFFFAAYLPKAVLGDRFVIRDVLKNLSASLEYTDVSSDDLYVELNEQLFKFPRTSFYSYSAEYFWRPESPEKNGTRIPSASILLYVDSNNGEVRFGERSEFPAGLTERELPILTLLSSDHSMRFGKPEGKLESRCWKDDGSCRVTGLLEPDIRGSLAYSSSDAATPEIVWAGVVKLVEEMGIQPVNDL